ncbi:hypothetical protein [Ensifer sp. M14]|uniref:hypothetical protein n=1 Tax=Ensifer sp. M14 TaxID=2203782 RepID=UPI0011C05536|nr:hypothetical protein [Ensifer sp. M14]
MFYDAQGRLRSLPASFIDASELFLCIREKAFDGHCLAPLLDGLCKLLPTIFKSLSDFAGILPSLMSNSAVALKGNNVARLPTQLLGNAHFERNHDFSRLQSSPSRQSVVSGLFSRNEGRFRLSTQRGRWLRHRPTALTKALERVFAGGGGILC